MNWIFRAGDRLGNWARKRKAARLAPVLAQERERSLEAFKAQRQSNDARGDFYVSIADGEATGDPNGRASDRKAGPAEDTDRARAKFLFSLLGDIDTLGDIAKSDDAGYRAAVERIQKRRWESGIRTDGYELYFPGEPMPESDAQPQSPVTDVVGTGAR